MLKNRRFSEKSANATKDIAMRYFESLGGSTALGLYISLRYNDWVSASTHSVNPRDFIDLHSFRSAYAATKLLSKLGEEGVGLSLAERRESAIQRYLEVESSIKDKTRILRSLLFSNQQVEFENVRSILYLARDKIAMILQDITLPEILDLASWGPGASSSIRGVDTSGTRKSSFACEVSTNCIPYAKAMVYYGFRFPGLENIREKNVVEITTVPKSSKIDRIIGIEPDLNIFIQKGLGSLIKKRLRSKGLDLNNTPDRNGRLAQLGSRDSNLATIDLSSASDSISRFLVEFLLPEKWFLALDLARTPAASIDGTVIPLEKFSSMGNGFTFELESLIFYALSLSTCIVNRLPCENVSVFGDDIIIPTAAYHELCEVLKICGFSINKEKSFHDSYFRESCGHHYFDGHDTKPVYIKAFVFDSLDQELVKFANAVRRLSCRWYLSDIHDSHFSSFYKYLKSRSHRRRPVIPDGFGDGAFIGTFEEALPYVVRSARNLRKRGFEGFRVKTLLPKAKTASSEDLGRLLDALSCMGRRVHGESHGTGSNEYPLRKLVRYRYGTIICPEWKNPLEFHMETLLAVDK